MQAQRKPLAERVAIVTGAASGIGRAIAQQFGCCGASVACIDIHSKAAEETAQHIREYGAKALAISCDISDPEMVKNAVDATVQQFGQLHILVNNAGISPLCAFDQITLEEWNRVIAINLTGAFLMCQAALPYLRRAGVCGRIINIGSLAGQTGGIAVGAHYSASKAGLMVLGKQLAKTLAPYGVTVNNIAPATTDTPLTQAWPKATLQALCKQIPLGRLGKPEDIAEVAVFLASDSASFITGATINVNGGLFID
ncbi:MAG: SDR family oxidoreductase [Anaerolineae bacterium]|nr:SDR family oxidoreductase [Anaerolineae bacterium]